MGKTRGAGPVLREAVTDLSLSRAPGDGIVHVLAPTTSRHILLHCHLRARQIVTSDSHTHGADRLQLTIILFAQLI